MTASLAGTRHWPKHLLMALKAKGGAKGYLRFSDIQKVAEQTKPSGVATSFSDADDVLSDFLFVPTSRVSAP